MTTPQPDKNDLNFYREMNNKFQNQTKNPQLAIFEQDYSLWETDDQQPELYDPISRNLVIFDKFDGSEKYIDRFKKTLKNFGDSKNQLFDSVIYGEILDQDRVIEVLGEDFYNDLLEVKDKVKLGRTIFGLFARCMILNEILSKYNFFVKVFKRRDKFRFLIKNKVVGKNKVTRILSSSVIKKFNRYEFIKQKLAHKEKIDFTAIDIVYEPVYDENLPIPCFFTSHIQLAFRSYIGRFKDGKEEFVHYAVKQCHYCQKFFKKTTKRWKTTLLFVQEKKE